MFDVTHDFTNTWPDRVRVALRMLASKSSVVASATGDATILLHGSTARGVEDAFSDVDVWIFPPVQSASEFIEFTVGERMGQAQIETRSTFETRIRRCDFPVIFELRHAILLSDPDGWGKAVLSLARREMSTDVRAAWFAYHYIEMRNDHRSIDNPIERGDTRSVLLSLAPTLAHALRAAMVLDLQPYPYTKWLPTEAARTPTGGQIVPRIDEIIDLLGAGALRERGPVTQHPINSQLEEIRHRLVTGARSAGLDGRYLTEWYMCLDARDQIRRCLVRQPTKHTGSRGSNLVP